MLITLLALLAAAPSAAQAEQLAKHQQWDELYLAFSAAAPKDAAPKDARRIAQALSRGCSALLPTDAVLAMSLGEKSVAFANDADAALCVVQAALKTDQRSEADTLLRKALTDFPRDARFHLELGRLMLLENEPRKAVELLSAVPAKSKQAKEAAALLAQAREQLGHADAEKAGARAIEREVAKAPFVAAAAAEAPRGKTRLDPSSVSASYESGIDSEGRRTRSNKHFRFRYFNGQRDFGSRADYEGTVQAALEVARLEAQKFLGRSREASTDVILYSIEEFTLHHGGQAAATLAGFYSENAIRMNDSAAMNDKNQSVLVHEYVHAALDEAASFRAHRLPNWLNEGTAQWVEWQHEGADGVPRSTRSGLKQIGASGRLPPFAGMEKVSMANQDNPAVRYALSGAAVDELVKRQGIAGVVGLFEEVGKGASFPAVFQARYSQTVEEFEEHLLDDLKSH